MSESQKNQAVQRNQVGKKQSFPIIRDDDDQNDSLKKSPGSEYEKELTEEIKKPEDKHPYMQGIPAGSQEKRERIF